MLRPQAALAAAALLSQSGAFGFSAGIPTMTAIRIDLRSDTVTRPTAAMYAAMAAAPVGDDVYRDDPTVMRLECLAAEMLGFESALFMASGTQSNLVALLSHCQRGDEYIVGDSYHSRRYEGGGAAVLGGIAPESLPANADGTLELERIEAAIKPDDVHFVRSRLLALENTWQGRVIPQTFIESACGIANEHGLAKHLDGARVFNAAAATGTPARDLAAPFDSLSVCLSKGLGAPVGSVLLGTTDFIDEARRWRKVVGGGLRQAGVLAACGIVSLEVMTKRLAEDHANARLLADLLADVDELSVDEAAVQTNMVFVDLPAGSGAQLTARLREGGIAVSGPGPRVRLVLHNDVSSEDVRTLVAQVKAFFARASSHAA